MTREDLAQIIDRAAGLRGYRFSPRWTAARASMLADAPPDPSKEELSRFLIERFEAFEGVRK